MPSCIIGLATSDNLTSRGLSKYTGFESEEDRIESTMIEGDRAVGMLLWLWEVLGG